MEMNSMQLINDYIFLVVSLLFLMFLQYTTYFELHSYLGYELFRTLA